ncbi:hypothetical protein KQC08_15185 [Leptospira sp. Pond_2020]|nr:hypothetical protein [Leptospira sp. Pond_2020]
MSVKSLSFDSFIIFPGIVSVVFLFILKKSNILPSEINLLTWFCTVFLIDVAHVYSPLFRSYFNMESKSMSSYNFRICS